MARRRRRKILIISLMVVALIAVLAPLSYYGLLVWQLRQVIAETDALDPGWRLEDILAAREVIPDDQNSAHAVLSAAKLLPEEWPPLYEDRDDPPTPLSIKLDELRAPHLMDAELAAELQQELEKQQQAVVEAKRLAGIPRGRYQFPSGHKERERFDEAAAIRKISLLLDYDAIRLAHQSQIEDALVSCRAIVNAARSVGDDPRTVAQLVRLDKRRWAIVAVERVLSQGQASPSALKAIQADVEAETRHNAQLTMLRGDRAIYHEAWSDPEHATLTLKRSSAAITLLRHGFENFSREIQEREERILKLYPSTFAIKGNHVRLLRAMNRGIEIANQHCTVQLGELDALKQAAEERVKNANLWSLYSSLLGDLACSGHASTARAHWNSQAELRCAVAALAAERFRIEQGKWPETLAQLVPDYLPHVPNDPFADGPLNYRRLADGVVVYSVGRDGVDHAGRLPRHEDPNVSRDNSDLGFRLWDAHKRRQPPQPSKPPAPVDPKAAEPMKRLMDKLSEILQSARP